jgi:low temperature requirement protein LtrA
LLFVASVFVPEPLRYYLWGFATLIALVMPLLTLIIGKNDEKIQSQIALLIDVNPSLVERFGLFTIIVLGEVIVGIISGVLSHHHLSLGLGSLTLFSVLIAVGLWWLYFDYISHKIPIRNIGKFTIWYYLHLPVVMSIVIIGAGLANIIETYGHVLHPEINLIFVVPFSVVLIGLALLGFVVKHPEDHMNFIKRSSIATVLIAVIILFLGFVELNHLKLIIIIAFLLLIPVIVALHAWVNYAARIK